MSAEVLARTISRMRTYVVVAALLAILACSALADNAITGISVAKKSDCVVIRVQGNCALRMSTLVSPSGRYLGFQFPCKLATKGRIVGIHTAGIYNVRYTAFQANPPVTRVVLNTTRKLAHSTNWSDDRRSVEIIVMKPVEKALTLPTVVSSVKATAKEALGVAESTFPQTRVAEVPVVQVKTLGVTEVVSASGAVEPEYVQPLREQALPIRVASASTKSVKISPVNYEPKVSVNFLNADINDVLKAISVQSGRNIVASKDVTGNVTVSLNRVTMDQAMDYVAKLSGYSYVKENGTYLVAAKDKLGAMAGGVSEEPVVEIVAIQYTDADDLMALLATQCPNAKASKANIQSQSGGAKDKAGTGRSRLVLSGSAESVAAAKNLIGQIEDSMMAQTAGQKMEVYRVMYVKPSDLAVSLTSMLPGISVSPAPSDGFDLSAPEGVEVDESGSKVKQATAETTSASPAGVGAISASASVTKLFDAKKRYSAIVITGPADQVDKALEMAAKLDVKSPQVKIDAKITSINENGEKQLGLTWDWGVEGNISFTEVATHAWARDATGFSTLLKGIIEDGNGELLASPSLVCLEGKPGVFWVGNEVTYVSSVSATASGEKTYETRTAKDGVQLRVVASVSPDGYITLNMHPEVSTLSFLPPVGGVTLPKINRRFTDHTVRVKNGQTIVIGGLIRNDAEENMSKVPGLSSIPLLGHLFRHKGKTKDRTEVVMFITATVLAN